MSCSCEKRKYKDFQEFDESNFPAVEIRDIFDTKNHVYYYIIKSVGYRDNKLVETGCAPNFQGKIVTLCTCKHYMRTYNSIQEGCWIAGFTSIDAMPNKRGNFLYYLAQVKKIYASHFGLWTSNVLIKKAKGKKNTRKNPFGDLYEPNRLNLIDKQKFDPFNYYSPCEDHRHANGMDWHLDIIKRYKIRNSVEKRISKLLVFDPKYSYVWTKPQYKLKKQFTRGVKSALNLEDLRQKHIVEI